MIDEKKPKDAEKLMKVITTTCGKYLLRKRRRKNTRCVLVDRRCGRGETRVYKKTRKMQRINAKAGTKQDEKEKMETEYKESRGIFRKIITQSKEKK